MINEVDMNTGSFADLYTDHFSDSDELYDPTKFKSTRHKSNEMLHSEKEISLEHAIEAMSDSLKILEENPDIINDKELYHLNKIVSRLSSYINLVTKEHERYERLPQFMKNWN